MRHKGKDMKIALLVSLCLLALNIYAENHKHGTVKVDDKGMQLIWDDNSNMWVNIESFWIEYANTKGGLTWGKSSQYPEYSAVKEHDTLLIQLKEGNCLMEFFHERWRRANDVRRWDDKLNSYGGCPYVFD